MAIEVDGAKWEGKGSELDDNCGELSDGIEDSKREVDDVYVCVVVTDQEFVLRSILIVEDHDVVELVTYDLSLVDLHRQ
jgi:hypothetical protein